MRRFVLGWKRLGHETLLKAHIVNYADDLVICCRGRAQEALVTMRDMMSKLKLTVNETKMRVCKLPEEKFDFLGYSFGRCYSPKTARAYLGTTPAKKRVQRICRAISEETGRNKTLLDHETVIVTLNRMMIGWANYSVSGQSARRIEQWKNTLAGSFVSGCAPNTSIKERERSDIPTNFCTISLDWSRLLSGLPAFRGRHRDTFSESWMREIRLSSSMSGNRKQSQAKSD